LVVEACHQRLVGVRVVRGGRCHVEVALSDTVVLRRSKVDGSLELLVPHSIVHVLLTSHIKLLQSDLAGLDLLVILDLDARVLGTPDPSLNTCFRSILLMRKIRRHIIGALRNHQRVIGVSVPLSSNNPVQRSHIIVLAQDELRRQLKMIV
jgi:hypothetical protein